MHKIQDLMAQYGKRYMVAEAPGAPAEFAAADSAGSAFAFGLQHAILESVNLGRAMPDLMDYLHNYPVERMGTFLSNHDNFAGARVFRQLDGDETDYRQAATTLLTLPGIPFIYYGEEIGQGMSAGVQYDDQALRGPMSWDSSGKGFSDQPPYRPLAGNREHFNVESEQGNPSSLLAHYTAMIHLRGAVAALRDGDFKPLTGADAPMLVFVRTQGDSRALVAINYASTPSRVALDATQAGIDWHAAYPQGSAVPLAVRDGVTWIEVAARQSVVLTAGGMSR
jgi:glycosidase